MAIKGKGKTRRRTVAQGPRPAYVPPRRPFWRHPAFVTAVIAVVLAGIGIAIYAAVIHAHNTSLVEARRADRAKERVIVTDFSSKIQSALQGITTPQLDTLIPFPELSDISAKIKDGKPLPEDLAGTGRDNAKLAGLAAEQIQTIDVAALISGHRTLLPLLDAQSYIVQSLKVYQQAGTMFRQATKVTGEGRTALLDRAKDLLGVGGSLFSTGYQKVINVMSTLGVQPQLAQPPQPTPTFTASPGETASPKASGGKGASPSASGESKKKK